MKITMEIDTCEELDEWIMIKDCKKYYIAIEDIRAEIRRIVKYSGTVSDETYRHLEDIKNLLPEESL